jgi:hypothetical protein
MIANNRTNSKKRKLRVIRTARTEKAINSAARSGFLPLLKRVQPSPEIKSKFAVRQNRKTGEIELVSDYRGGGESDDWELVLGFDFYYPHAWPNPFAAYLLPPDLKVNEDVILNDLIEDVVGSQWNQGDTYRLKSCKARWTGNDFVLNYDSDRTPNFFVG